MSTIVSEKYKCAMCGSTNEYNELASTNTFGSPDLDLRPAEMKRSTMPLWVQECPECGYVSKKVSDPSHVTREWLESERYQTCDGLDFASDLAERFYRDYLIKLQGRDVEEAFFAVLYTVWACDDARDDTNATICRKLAVFLASKLLEGKCDNAEDILMIRADLMRRAGQFEELLETYSSVRFKKKHLKQIMKCYYSQLCCS